jgi:hypothetical protein
MTKRKPQKSRPSTPVASASKAKPKRQKPVINQNVVATYLAKLEAALGDDRAFLPVFETLKSDPQVQQGEAVELASKFVAKTAESTARAKALERVLKRHSALASFRLKQQAMAGRSAA